MPENRSLFGCLTVLRLVSELTFRSESSPGRHKFNCRFRVEKPDRPIRRAIEGLLVLSLASTFRPDIYFPPCRPAAGPPSALRIAPWRAPAPASPPQRSSTKFRPRQQNLGLGFTFCGIYFLGFTFRLGFTFCPWAGGLPLGRLQPAPHCSLAGPGPGVAAPAVVNKI